MLDVGKKNIHGNRLLFYGKKKTFLHNFSDKITLVKKGFGKKRLKLSRFVKSKQRR